MDVKGITAERADEMYRYIAEAQARVDREGPAALDAIDRENRERIPLEWKAIAEKQAEVSIPSFVNVLWNEMCIPDGLEFGRADDAATGTVQMHCTYCPWHAIARAAGATEVGYVLFCKTDPYMIAGFNQAAGPGARTIAFSRSKTLMQGDAYCDHCYTYDAESEPGDG